MLKTKERCKEKFEFLEEKLTHLVTMTHFGTHLCFPIKPKEGIDIKEIATSSHNKTSKAKRDILYNMIDEGANFKILKTKHCNLWTKNIK